MMRHVDTARSIAWTLLCLLAAGIPSAAAQELPITPIAGKPALLLQAEPDKGAGRAGVQEWGGEVVAKEGSDYVAVQKEQVVVAHKGAGSWSASFRYTLTAGPVAGEYTLWARWMQGGDPKVCAQSFTLLAGPSADKLEERGVYRLTNTTPWKLAWVNAPKTLALKADDAVIEIRNAGRAQDAKVFDAFLLTPGNPPPPAETPAEASARVETPTPDLLPVAASVANPVIFLHCGKEVGYKPGDLPHVVDALGKAEKGEGAESVSVQRNEAFVRHKGFGEWGCAFEYQLGAPAGYYSFYARYMSGGEPSQVRQTFTVLAGRDPQSLGLRGIFQTVNKTPFKQQWIEAKGAFALFPGDRVIRILNTGKAHDVKVFAGFALTLQSPMPAWITPARGQLRSAFLSMGKQLQKPVATLCLLDGPGPDRTLFEGLTQDSLRPRYDSLQIQYMTGREADDAASRLGIVTRPAIAIVDSDKKVLGVLAEPASVDQVARFLADPATGSTPSQVATRAVRSEPLQNGSPTAWLIATGWPGRCGIAHLGLNAEAEQRPNPGDPLIYGYYTGGIRTGQWQPAAADAKGVCRLVTNLPESYAWGRGTNFAVAYVYSEKPTDAVLHLQHSGTESAVFLDGTNCPLATDPAPTSPLPRYKSPDEGVVERGGQETHDDIVAPQEAQPAMAASLHLKQGWNCLVLKLVHRQGKGESVFFTATLTKPDGAGLKDIASSTSDPTASPLAASAARLWPLMSLEGVPGNLPRPGEPLTLVVDMRANMAKRSPLFDGPFPAIQATLRVRMLDYDGKPAGVFETKGSFPAAVRLDLGKAPAPGYYALLPELYDSDARLIHRFPADGFTVVLGSAAQKQRVDQKKLMESWYYAFNDWDTFAPWLERTGMFKNVGSTPGAGGKDAPGKWADATSRGIVLVADFAGDSNWMNNSEADAKKVVEMAPAHTRYFKSVNEIDGRWNGEEGVAWDKTRSPAKWVERAKWQYEAVHAVRPDAICFSGSTYCAGVDRKRTDHPEILGPRAWFKKCLELGLDQYVDAWDVHAYPQYPPRLEAPSVTNSPSESDQGILSVYKELGRSNTKPFLLGETSAYVTHGFTGLRWQADTLTKMVAWVNSRPDWLGIALCASHVDRRATLAEYNMAHNPGEAAIYTAGALIDGLPYKRLDTDDKEIQAASFGQTFLVWRADDKTSQWTMPLDASQQWLIVDVVGRARELPVKDGKATFAIGTSPFYVLTRAEYERLTRMN